MRNGINNKPQVCNELVTVVVCVLYNADVLLTFVDKLACTVDVVVDVLLCKLCASC